MQYVIYHHPSELTEEEQRSAICIPQKDLHFHLVRSLVPELIEKSSSLKLPERGKRNFWSVLLSVIPK